ncbi:adenosine deaminase [Rhipicephalus sanguineus]|uniref:adenosine deaminase n=1 Tax=Rhipicephalus sanguineus TaxID=34632 RepID=UPI001893F8CE|nr:adenosine deaminase [Rhipicephalus sanguineus]
MALPKYKIQLHSHLTTGIRHATIWELAQQKGLDLGYTSVEDIREKTRPKEGTTLANYLKEIFVFVEVVIGDRDAMERVAYEEAVDQAAQGVIYSEMLLSPTALLAHSSAVHRPQGIPESMVTTRDVLDAALRGLRKAELETGAKFRLVLSCARGSPEWAPEVVELCREYGGRGVVGIDVCGVVRPGDEQSVRVGPNASEYGEEVTDPRIIETFQRAVSYGVHRTVHAAEAGPPATVLRAVRELHAERIGHGYRAVADGGDAYRQALAAGIHFECCPTSSYLTGGVDRNAEHPILRLKRDGASFSLNTDNPTVTHTTLDDEYRLALKLGLTPDDILRCNRSAISASFLPDDEKWELEQKFNRLICSDSANA